VRNVRIVRGLPVITLDRVVQSLDGDLINGSHKAYRYRIYPQSHGATWSACLRNWSMCSAAQLRRQFAKGAHPADGTRPLAGHAVLLVRNGRLPRTYDVMNQASHYRFVSAGDRHSCRC
jgi:hypothetical protein